MARRWCFTVSRVSANLGSSPNSNGAGAGYVASHSVYISQPQAVGALIEQAPDWRCSRAKL